MTEIRAGAGRARIVLPDERDPHRVRVLVLDDGVQPLAVAAVDRSLPAQCHAGICRVLAHVTHVPEERVLLCVSPSAVGGPDMIGGADVQHAVEDAVAWAAFAARSTCRPARLGGGPSRSDHPGGLAAGAATGPIHTGPIHTGSVHTGPIHTGFIHTGPIQVEDAEGRPIALVMSVDGPPPDAVERDGLVALALPAGVTARLADLVDAPLQRPIC